MADYSDLDAKLLVDQGFVVVQEVQNANGVTRQDLVIAAPQSATVLPRRGRLTVPEDFELPYAKHQQDP